MDAASQLLSYNLRAVRIGIWTSAAVFAVLAAIALVPGQPLHSRVFALLLLVEGCAICVHLRLPWRRLFEAGSSVQTQIQVMNVTFVGIAIGFTGGGRSDLYLLYALTIAYSAAALPRRDQLLLFPATVVSYVAALAATGWEIRGTALALRLSILALLGFVTSFLAAELDRRAQEKEHLSLHDPLTELANRSLFQERVSRAVAAGRTSGRPVAVLVIDLDRFKEVNDALGHALGDALLCQVGPRLGDELRDSDTVARFGGDEFAVLLPEVDGVEAAHAIGRRLAAALDRPFVVEGLTLDVEASVGVAVLPDHGRSADELLRHADVAMYAAKEVRSGCEVYSEQDVDGATGRRLALLGELRRALETRQLVLHYQPKVDLRTGRLRGVEALVRWAHPERGLIAPDTFIPLVEQTGLIGPLTLYVLDDALRQARAWDDAGLPLTVAVNISARNLHDVRFAGQVRDLLSEHRVPPGRLELELTESTIMSHPARALQSLIALGELGVPLVLDDFGTGYSSLAQLRRLPVTEIKIDRSFVVAMEESGSDEVLVRAMIDIGRNLGLSVVAEGVETAAAWERLRELGCDVAQGYYLCRPIPAEEVDGWATRWTAASAA